MNRNLFVWLVSSGIICLITEKSNQWRKDGSSYMSLSIILICLVVWAVFKELRERAAGTKAAIAAVAIVTGTLIGTIVSGTWQRTVLFDFTQLDAGIIAVTALFILVYYLVSK